MQMRSGGSKRTIRRQGAHVCDPGALGRLRGPRSSDFASTALCRPLSRSRDGAAAQPRPHTIHGAGQVPGAQARVFGAVRRQQLRRASDLAPKDSRRPLSRFRPKKVDADAFRRRDRYHTTPKALRTRFRQPRTTTVPASPGVRSHSHLWAPESPDHSCATTLPRRRVQAGSTSRADSTLSACTFPQRSDHCNTQEGRIWRPQSVSGPLPLPIAISRL